jgi:hypothetical protein
METHHQHQIFWRKMHKTPDMFLSARGRTLDMEVHFGWDNQGNFAHTR